MSNHLNDRIRYTDEVVLVGAGKMAAAYVDVLKGLRAPFRVVGRDRERARALALESGAAVEAGGLASWLERGECPRRAIVATGVDRLEEVTTLLLDAGCLSILLEKPGATDGAGIRRIADLAAARRASVSVGFNRRYYASVDATRGITREDGGVTSAFFDFTEIAYRIAQLPTATCIKQHWFLANSLHVVDLAFHLIGSPVSVDSRISGHLPWHDAAAQFVGSGITDQKILFSYRADWGAPGRWKVELFTPNRRLLLCPLEGLRAQAQGSFEEHQIDFDDTLDKMYKPGVYRQVEAWMNGDPRLACAIGDLARMLPVYERIAGYDR